MTNFTTKWPAVVFWPGPAKSSQNWKKAEGPDFRCFSNANDLWYQILHSRPDNLKRSRQKNSWNPIIKKFFFVKLHFWTFSQFKNSFLAIFEIAKNGIWSKKFIVKLIYLISQVFFGMNIFKFSGPLWYRRRTAILVRMNLS